MITDSKYSDTKALFDGQRVAQFANVAAVAVHKLQQVLPSAVEILAGTHTARLWPENFAE